MVDLLGWEAYTTTASHPFSTRHVQRLACSLLHALSRVLALVLIPFAIRDRREAAVIRRIVEALAAFLVGLDAYLFLARRRLLLVRRGVCRRLGRFRYPVRLQL